MQQKDIVWISVPYSNMEEEKIRPALVVSNTDYNQKNPDVVICSITSNLEKKPYSVFISQKNMKTGQLPLESKIRADKLMQVEKKRILKPFASLDDRTFQLVTQEIISLISS